MPACDRFFHQLHAEAPTLVVHFDIAWDGVVTTRKKHSEAWWSSSAIDRNHPSRSSRKLLDSTVDIRRCHRKLAHFSAAPATCALSLIYFMTCTRSTYTSAGCVTTPTYIDFKHVSVCPRGAFHAKMMFFKKESDEKMDDSYMGR